MNGGLTSSPLEGLTSPVAHRLAVEVGPNVVAVPREPFWARLARKFWAPVPWMLEATVALELLASRWLDASLVALVLVLNGAIGLVQEGRAASALALLRSRLEVSARVLRDGSWSLLPASELVPGDVVHVRMGDFVPADGLVLQGEILADESALSGESVPVERGPGAVAYSGTVVQRGEASVRITETGPRTMFGRTAQLVGTSAPAEHLGSLVLRMVRVFVVLDVLLAAAGTAYLSATGAPLDTVLAFAVVLLLASVPVALPAAFSLAGALGARQLATHGILTVRLPVLQDAATMDVLCVDKTGTLTSNRLSVERVAPLVGSEEDLLRLAAAASDPSTQDPIDLAILTAAPGMAPGWERVASVPFDPATKRSQATWVRAGAELLVTKGAPGVIASLTGWQPGTALEELAADGARVLAVAMCEPPGDWTPCGLVALADTVREDAAALLVRLQSLGIRTVMVTGDSAATARAVATQLGMSGSVITAEELETPGR